MTIFSFKNSTMTFLLLIAFLLSAWSILLTKHARPLLVKHANEPDAFMENIVATIMNKQGSPSLKIEAPKMTHYAEDDTTHILHPRVTVYRHSPQPWFIHSDYADASKGTQEIIFSDNVVIHHPADIANPNTTMETLSLTVFPDKQQAETHNPVTIMQPDTTIHAIGMLADLNNGTVKLLSEAKGDYVPAS